jgi:hypothetical protein
MGETIKNSGLNFLMQYDKLIVNNLRAAARVAQTFATDLPGEGRVP